MTLLPEALNPASIFPPQYQEKQCYAFFWIHKPAVDVCLKRNLKLMVIRGKQGEAISSLHITLHKAIFTGHRDTETYFKNN